MAIHNRNVVVVRCPFIYGIFVFFLASCTSGRLLTQYVSKPPISSEYIHVCSDSVNFSAELDEYPPMASVSDGREIYHKGNGDYFILYTSHNAPDGFSICIDSVNLSLDGKNVFAYDYHCKDSIDIERNMYIACDSFGCGAGFAPLLKTDSLVNRKKYFKYYRGIKITETSKLSTLIQVRYKNSECDTVIRYTRSLFQRKFKLSLKKEYPAWK